MSLDNPLTFNLCHACDKRVEDHEPGVSYTTVEGVLYHPACAPEAVVEASAQYAREVHDYLTTGPNHTRPVNAHPLLDEEETEEMLQAYLLGTPAAEFAGKLENRDIAVFEEMCDPYPQREYPEVPMN